MDSDVIAIVQIYAGRRKLARLSSEVMYDLHIDADTAEEMLLSIRERFGTQFDDLWFRDYFHSELEVMLARLLETLCALLKYRIETKKPLTVEHLCRVVETGKWFEP